MADEGAESIAALQEKFGPGGVETPTPAENSGTPTPQEPEPAAPPLKPLAALLGQEQAQTPVSETLEGETSGETQAEPPAAVVPTRPNEAAARINKLTAEKWEEKRAREAAEARARLAEETLAELARANPELAPAGAAQSQPNAERRFTEAELRTEAARMHAVGQFNSAVDAAVIAGRAKHEDFDAAVEGLKKITGPIVPTEFLQAALETGAASELIYELGKNPVEADRILSLPPLRQAVALARFADGLKTAAATQSEAQTSAPAAVSKAPAPIPQKIGGSAWKELPLDDPKLSMEEFIRRRNEAEQKQRKRA